MTAQGTYQRRSGFTLIELLVVIAIIGVLAAILVPTANIVITRAKEAKINFEVKQLSVALEHYKNEFGVYPLDMSDPFFMQAHVNKISRRHKMGPVVNLSNLSDASTWYGAALPNPWQADFGGPATRSPQTMDPAEAMVFFLSEISKNADYPLGYRFDGSNWLIVPGERYELFEFDETRLKDYDQDGWREYIQAAGPPVPLVYFSAQSYATRDYNSTPPSVTGVTQVEPLNPSADIPVTWPEARGIAKPYIVDTNRSNPVNPIEFVEPKKFQLIAAGMDGDFGLNPPENPQTFKYFDAPGKNYQLQPGDLDNFTNFAEGRLDTDFEQ